MDALFMGIVVGMMRGSLHLAFIFWRAFPVLSSNIKILQHQKIVLSRLRHEIAL